MRIVIPQKLYITAAASLAVALLSGMFVYSLSTQPWTRVASASTQNSASDTVYLAGAGAGAAETIEAPAVEIHIANNGLVLLRGARVTSVSGNTIYVATKSGSVDFVWIVQTGSATKLLTSKGEKQTLADIQPGDYVKVTGTLLESGARSRIDADFVRE